MGHKIVQTIHIWKQSAIDILSVEGNSGGLILLTVPGAHCINMVYF